MQKIIYILILGMTIIKTSFAQQKDSVFVYEYPSKIMNTAIIGFIVIKNDKILEEVSYKIRFQKSRITKISKTNNSLIVGKNIQWMENGNIYLYERKIECLSTNNLFKKYKATNAYSYIVDDFLEKSNSDKLNLLARTFLSFQNKKY